jgi:outer membrane receptor protein involved in Fe transport
MSHVSQRLACACALAVVGSLLAPLPARAQAHGAVRGRVVAAADGSPVGRATVTLTAARGGGSQRATSDEDGWFAFPLVEPGEHRVSATSAGFATRDVRVTVEPRDVSTIDLALALANVDIDLTVAGVADRVSTHSPGSTVLSSDDLESLPAFQRASLTDAIVTSAPGMIRGHDDFVHVRGQEVALNPLINGVSFWENPHAVFSAGVDPGLIASANVMTGGFPAEYGNRFGGVIDIVTKSGFDLGHRGAVDASAGASGRRRLSGEIGGARGAVGYFVSGSVSETDRFLSPPEPDAVHDEGRTGHVFAQVDGSLGARGWLRAVLMVDGSANQIPVTRQDVLLRPAALATQRSRQQTAVVGWTRAWSAATLSVTGYQRWSDARLDPAAGPLTARAAWTRELHTLGAKADATRVSGRHAVKAGVDAVRLRPEENVAYDYSGYRELTHLLGLPHIHVAGQRIDFSGHDTGYQVSGYVQDTMQLGRRVTLDAGVRLDRHALLVTSTHASPRVNLAVRVGEAIAHASYNRYFVPPPIEGLLSSSAGLTQRINEIAVALPALAPTIDDQLEAGVTMPLPGVRLAATGYVRATDHPVHTTVWPDSRIYSYASFDRARAYGAELRADLRLPARLGITGGLNYAAGRVYFHNPVTGGFITEAAHVTDTSRFLAPMDQTHTLTARAGYRHARSGAYVATSLEYGSGTPIGHGGGDHAHAPGDADHAHGGPASDAARVDGHVTANVSLGVDLLRRGSGSPRLTVRVDVENVANRPYVIARESAFTPAQFSVPRMATATVRVEF